MFLIILEVFFYNVYTDCYNIIYPSGIHLGGAFGGSKMRQASEIGGEGHMDVDEEINKDGLEIPKNAPSTGFDMGIFADEYAD